MLEGIPVSVWVNLTTVGDFIMRLITVYVLVQCRSVQMEYLLSICKKGDIRWTSVNIEQINLTILLQKYLTDIQSNQKLILPVEYNRIMEKVKTSYY